MDVAANSCVRRDVVKNGRTLPGAEVEAEGAIGRDPELSVCRFVREKKWDEEGLTKQAKEDAGMKGGYIKRIWSRGGWGDGRIS